MDLIAWFRSWLRPRPLKNPPRVFSFEQEHWHHNIWWCGHNLEGVTTERFKAGDILILPGHLQYRVKHVEWLDSTKPGDFIADVEFMPS